MVTCLFTVLTVMPDGNIDRIWWLWQLQNAKKRTYAIAGTHTFGNDPPSANVSLTEDVTLGYVAGWQTRQIKSLMSSLDGPFCYVYL
jgi:tyrosinase